MVCEGVLNLFGTSSKEIEERTKEQYIPQFQKLTEENLALTSEINHLKQLLLQHNIAH